MDDMLNMNLGEQSRSTSPGWLRRDLAVVMSASFIIPKQAQKTHKDDG